MMLELFSFSSGLCGPRVVIRKILVCAYIYTIIEVADECLYLDNIAVTFHIGSTKTRADFGFGCSIKCNRLLFIICLSCILYVRICVFLFLYYWLINHAMFQCKLSHPAWWQNFDNNLPHSHNSQQPK